MMYDFVNHVETEPDNEPEPDVDEFDYPVSFDGPCTCVHDSESHGWGSCGVIDIINEVEVECPCEAGWTE